MIRPPLEVADIIRSHGSVFVERHHRWLTVLHLKSYVPLPPVVPRRSAGTSSSVIVADSEPSLTTRA